MFQKKTDDENLFVAIRQLNCMTITTTLLNAAVKSPHSVSVSQKRHTCPFKFVCPLRNVCDHISC